MEYTVYNCDNVTEIYEDRLYQCYGQFQDGGLVYTFTQRLDLPVKECFVGTVLEGVEHYVMEAGVHCARGKEPSVHGMIMRKESDLECEAELSTPRSVNPRFSTSRTVNNNNNGGHKKHHNHNHRNHRVKQQQQPETTTKRFENSSACGQTVSLAALMVTFAFMLISV